MPDEVTTQTETVTEQEKPGANPAVPADEWDKERAKATILQLRQFEKTAKEQAKKLAEYEEAERKRQDAELSETEKLKKLLAEKEATLKALSRSSLQREVADKTGLPVVFANRLQGETPEEMESDAKLILEALPKASQPKVGATNPGANATGQGETDEQKLSRIHGRGVDIFDPVTIKKLGGGVSVVKSAED